MELIVVLATIVMVALLASIPSWRESKRTGKKRRGGSMAGALGIVNELFAPSAANAAQILEEQAEARKPLPSPEDKDFLNGIELKAK
jgi:hypothetical protein